MTPLFPTRLIYFVCRRTYRLWKRQRMLVWAEPTVWLATFNSDRFVKGFVSNSHECNVNSSFHFLYHKTWKVIDGGDRWILIVPLHKISHPRGEISPSPSKLSWGEIFAPVFQRRTFALVSFPPLTPRCYATACGYSENWILFHHDLWWRDFEIESTASTSNQWWCTLRYFKEKWIPQILFEELKLDEKVSASSRLNRTSVQNEKSTSESVLSQLVDFHPLPAIVLEHRQVMALLHNLLLYEVVYEVKLKHMHKDACLW